MSSSRKAKKPVGSSGPASIDTGNIPDAGSEVKPEFQEYRKFFQGPSAVEPQARIRKHVARRLFSLRESLGLRQTDLDRMTGISHSTISNWETALSEPPYTALVILARALGVSVAYFAEGEIQPDDAPLPKARRGRPKKAPADSPN
jgi:ribosome-binding protein aMBF1 (putative translation factor)